MGELFDKEVNAQKESLKKLQGFTQAPAQAHGKVCDENERKKQTNKKKNDVRVKMLLMGGSTM